MTKNVIMEDNVIMEWIVRTHEFVMMDRTVFLITMMDVIINVKMKCVEMEFFIQMELMEILLQHSITKNVMMGIQ